MKFQLEIMLGNEEMIDIHHISRALRDIAYHLNEAEYPIDVQLTQEIRDANGNLVGEYKLVK